MCVRALSLEDDWSIHHKRGKVEGIPALVMEVTQQHLYSIRSSTNVPTHLEGMRGHSLLSSLFFMPVFNFC